MKIKSTLLLLLIGMWFCSFLSAQPTLSVTATATPSDICEGGQTTLQALPTGGTGTYTYVWESNPPGQLGYPTVTTVYTVTVDDGSETASASVTVVVNHVPGAAGVISGPDTVCAGSSNIPFSVPPVTDATAYVWSLPPGVSLTYVCQQNQIYANFSLIASSGVISVYGVNMCGYGPSSSFPVYVMQPPNVNAGADQYISIGMVAFLNGSVIGGSGSYSYVWSPANLLQNANMQNTTSIPLASSTVFTLAVTDSLTGCTSTDNVQVYVAGGSPLSCMATANPVIICQDSCTTLQAMPSGGSGSYTYTWTSVPPGAISTLQNPTVCPTVTTQYVLVVSDGSQTCSTSVTVQVIPVPVTLGAITGLTDVCVGTNNVVYSVPASPIITHYFWSLPAGASIVSGQYTNSIVVNYGPNAVSGNISVMGSGACGCVPSDTLVVTLHSTPIADAGPNQNINCGGAPLSIGTAALSGMTYSWSPSYALSNPNIAQPMAVPYGNTMYVLTVTDTVSGCYATDSVLITVVGAPVADAGLDQSINCGGPGVVIGTAPINGLFYSWTPAYGLSDDSIPQPTATPTTTTTYVLTVLDLATGCFDTDEVTVTVNLSPIADAGQNQTIVFGDNVWLYGSATGGSGNYSYYWMPDTLLPYPNLQNAITMPLSSPVVFTLLVTDNTTGCTATDSVSVDVVVATGESKHNVYLLIYPNPSDGTFNINTSPFAGEPFEINVFNTMGKIVYREQAGSALSHTLKLQTLSAGIYFIKLYNKKFSYNQILIVNR